MGISRSTTRVGAASCVGGTRRPIARELFSRVWRLQVRRGFVILTLCLPPSLVRSSHYRAPPPTPNPRMPKGADVLNPRLLPAIRRLACALHLPDPRRRRRLHRRPHHVFRQHHLPLARRIRPATRRMGRLPRRWWRRGHPRRPTGQSHGPPTHRHRHRRVQARVVHEDGSGGLCRFQGERGRGEGGGEHRGWSGSARDFRDGAERV